MKRAVFLALALLLCIVLAGCETPVPKLAAEDIATIRLINATTADFAEIPLSALGYQFISNAHCRNNGSLGS